MYQTIAQIAADPKVTRQAQKFVIKGAYGKKLRYVEYDDVSNISEILVLLLSKNFHN